MAQYKASCTSTHHGGSSAAATNAQSVSPFLAALGAIDAPDAASVRAILRARARRARFLSPKLFADPAWDMLLELYAAGLDQTTISISSLCIASGVPATTALRWIGVLTAEGLIERRSDPFDRRRVFVSLSSEATDSINAYFRAVPLGCACPAPALRVL